MSSRDRLLLFSQLSKMSKKIVLKLQLHCERCKPKAMGTVAGIEGVQSVAIDGKENKITVIGDADPVCVTASLRKFGVAELVSVGPSKDPEKKPEDPEKKPKDPEKKPDLTCVILPSSCDVLPSSCHGCSGSTYYRSCDVLPSSCHGCSGYTYYRSDESPNTCVIL